jgi:5-methyltetrahydropteroyltriglutamate--homocysteine methyltransferase
VIAARSTPPFRADHVGSLLRPPEVLRAREDAAAGRITPAERRAIEDRAIADVVRMQEDVGLQSATDGEFRRASWHMDFIYQLGGVHPGDDKLTVAFRNEDGELSFETPALVVDDRISLPEPGPIFGDDFRYLASAVTTATPKLTIPSPSMVHYRGGRAALDPDVYPDEDQFWQDLRYIRQINAALAGKPAGLTITTHMCRGNFQSSWAAEGGYDFVAEALFGELAVDGFFLEYDDARSGGFEPLRFVPPGKHVVLGLVTTKHPELESKDTLKRRIDEASRFVPLDQLCLSPQCGFSSTVEGNKLTYDDQVAKLRLIVEVAEEVWG